jgi:hypothetical protein
MVLLKERGAMKGKGLEELLDGREQTRRWCSSANSSAQKKIPRLQELGRQGQPVIRPQTWSSTR